MFLNIPRNPLLIEGREQSEAEAARIAIYGDLATCDISLESEKRLIQISVQDPTMNEDAMVIQTTWENVAADVLSSIGSRLLAFGKKKPAYLDGK